MRAKIRSILKKYKHIILIAYMPVYIIWFMWLERRTEITYTNVHCFVDDWIPFQEIFIIPYLLWFAYVAISLIFLFFQTKHLKDFYKCAGALMTGMTVCLIIYTLWPNAQNLRPDVMPRNNIFTDMISVLYSSDTSTNVCPSIHVYNSLCIHYGIAHSHYFHDKKGWKLASLTLCVLICLSTMFLKQHSFLDMVCAIILYIVVHGLIYRPILNWKRNHKKGSL